VAVSTALCGHDQHQPGEGQEQPANLYGVEALSEQQHTQTDQHERLNVVDHRGNGDRGMFVGTEQQHPVEDQRHPAQAYQNELSGADHGPTRTPSTRHVTSIARAPNKQRQNTTASGACPDIMTNQPTVPEITMAEIISSAPRDCDFITHCFLTVDIAVT
jgi:hypothetical protein